jgi:hypothetical protein
VTFAMRALVHAALGDADASVALLQQATFLMTMRGLPEMAALRKDPRARRILEQLDTLDRSAGRPRAPAEAGR